MNDILAEIVLIERRQRQMLDELSQTRHDVAKILAILLKRDEQILSLMLRTHLHSDDSRTDGTETDFESALMRIERKFIKPLLDGDKS